MSNFVLAEGTASPPQKKNDWRGIRTPASEETSALNWRLGPLGHPTNTVWFGSIESNKLNVLVVCKKIILIGGGFEPPPPKRLVPETSALDRSAIQPTPLAQQPPRVPARARGKNDWSEI